MFSRHQTWPNRIAFCQHKMIIRRQTCPNRIDFCRHTMFHRRHHGLTYHSWRAQLVTNVARGLPASSIAFTHHPMDIERVLPASFVSCTHRSTFVKQDLAALPLTFTYKFVISGVSFLYRILPAQGWPNVSYGLHESSFLTHHGHPTSSVACLYFLTS